MLDLIKEKEIDAEIFRCKSGSTRLTFSGGEMKVREYDKDEGFGIRVISDGKPGFSYCQVEEKINDSFKSALAISKFSPKSSPRFPGPAKIPSVKSSSKKVVELNSKELAEMLAMMRDGASKYGGLPKIIVSAGSEEIELENSEGFYGSYVGTEISAYAEVMDGRGSGYSDFSEISLGHDPFETGLRAAEMAKEMRHPKTIESGEYPVLAPPELISELLDILLPSFSGDWERRQISKLSKQRGSKVFDEKLSIYDDGLAGATGICPFDDEGIISEKRPLVENGTLKRFTYDIETAALAGRKENGSCRRQSYSSHPSSGMSNIVISPGDYTDIEEEENYLLVNSAHGSHTANSTTGDFGLEVNVAFLKKGGQIFPVRGFILSGNVFDVFNNIKAIEKRQKVYGNLVCPRMMLGGLSVVG
jgi:PmbA protein